MNVLVGTSGYSYKEWKGPFYPEKLPASQFLRYYAANLSTVEINNTFYRMPTSKLLEGWAAEVPAGFTFALKAPQRITHIKRLQDAADPTAAFLKTARILGTRLGPLLFQLPPFFKKDVPRLAAFLAEVADAWASQGTAPASPSLRIALEFRHASWFDDEVFEAMRARGAALCVAEGEELVSPLVATADWGYLRLRRDDYPDDVLQEWAERIAKQAWRQAFVYLKHDEGDAPGAALRLIQKLKGRSG
jgi:uncharacterized protein YecE (DUF72 family)